MAVVTLKSTQITNRDATPVVKSTSVQQNKVLHARGAIAGGAADSIASKYVFCSIPSNAKPISVRLSTTGTGTVGATDIGVYKDTLNGGAVVDADLFTSAKLLTTALDKFESIFESAVLTKINGEKPLWELAGLTADPGIMYDVVATLTAAVDAAHDMLLEIDYTL
jgi:hypothetical protein